MESTTTYSLISDYSPAGDQPEAIEKLRQAVSEGEKWAIQLVVTYSLPKPKPVDPDELAEFEERLSQLEQTANQH